MTPNTGRERLACKGNEQTTHTMFVGVVAWWDAPDDSTVTPCKLAVCHERLLQ